MPHDVDDGDSGPCSDVKSDRFLYRSFDTAHGRFDHIVHIDKVSALLAIFEDVDRLVSTSPTREDGEDSGIRIFQRLSRPIDVLISQGKPIDTERLSIHEHHLLLNLLCETIE